MGGNRLSLGPSDLVSRLRRLLLVNRAGRCDVANRDQAIARFQSLELCRLKRRSLSNAFEYRDAIIARLAFLAELDELTESEIGTSVLEETALILNEIALAAMAAAGATRTILGEETRH